MRLRGAAVALVALALAALALTASADQERGIDAYFAREWRARGLEPAPPSGDLEFLRRVTLDVVGRPPRPDEVRAFEKDPDRAKAIERLLASPEAASFFADTWLRLLLDYRFDEQAPLRVNFGAFHAWLAKAWSEDRPFGEVVRAMLAEEGDQAKKPAVNFVLAAIDPKEPPHALASRTARAFLGTRIECARCHDHPTARITRDDFWSFAAFFAGSKARARRTFDGYGVKLVDEPVEALEVPESDGGGRLAPRYLDGRAPDGGAKPREALARFVTGDPRFARAIVNRLWAQLTGHGFVEPVDALGEGEPEHAELFSELVREFNERESIRSLTRTILGSRYYQLSGAGPDGSVRARLRPQTPVQLLNALTWALDLDAFVRKLYEGFAANQALPEPYRNEAVFRIYLQLHVQKLLAPAGRAPEQVHYAGSVRLALELMNSKDLQGLVHVGWGRLAEIAREREPAKRIDAIFLVILGRHATEAERARYLAHVERRHGDDAAYEDVFWVLLNSSEFFFNH